jgi:hypothetical protein
MRLHMSSISRSSSGRKGSSRRILAMNGMRRFLDAMLSSPLRLPMSIAPHQERPDSPNSARVLAPLLTEGHASPAPCCHAIVLQAVHAPAHPKPVLVACVHCQQMPPLGNVRAIHSQAHLGRNRQALLAHLAGPGTAWFQSEL